MQNAIPTAVTVRKASDPLPDTNRPRNALERAAMCDDQTDAIRVIQRALGITNDRLAIATLSAPYRWSRISEFSRLTEIADWIRAECFEVMDLVQGEPISTIGD